MKGTTSSLCVHVHDFAQILCSWLGLFRRQLK